MLLSLVSPAYLTRSGFDPAILRPTHKRCMRTRERNALKEKEKRSARRIKQKNAREFFRLEDAFHQRRIKSRAPPINQ